jgi:hypothetical protein
MTVLALVSECDFIEGCYWETETYPRILILTNQQVSTLGDFGRLIHENLLPQLQVRYPNKSWTKGGG